MGRAFLAGGFVVAVAAGVESAVCILQQFAATAAKLAVALLMPAIEPDHLFYGVFFVPDAVHNAAKIIKGDPLFSGPPFIYSEGYCCMFTKLKRFP